MDALKLFILNAAYPAYLKKFYAARPHLEGGTFAENKSALCHDAFGWSDAWSNALGPYGYEVAEVVVNAGPAQKAWARENGVKYTGGGWLAQIVKAQVRSYRPDVVWYNHSEFSLLDVIRSASPSVRKVLGWVGSAFDHIPPGLDLVLTCAPESVDRIRRMGLRSCHLNHGFDPRILDRLAVRGKSAQVSFIGQLLRGSQYHGVREKILKDLANRYGIQIYSPSAGYTARDFRMASAKRGLYRAMQAAVNLGVPREVLAKLPVAGRAAKWTEPPQCPVDPDLVPYLKPAVFGLEMYQAIRDSMVSLNIHADSSPTHASNMRLFEATGVGTCLITDYRENIGELFDPDYQLVTFKTAGECVEKIKWLLENPARCEEIARAGQKRTLEEHTFSRRAARLDEIIRKELSK